MIPQGVNYNHPLTKQDESVNIFNNNHRINIWKTGFLGMTEFHMFLKKMLKLKAALKTGFK